MKLSLLSITGTAFLLFALTALDTTSSPFCDAQPLRGSSSNVDDVDGAEDVDYYDDDEMALTRQLQTCPIASIGCPLTKCSVTSSFGMRNGKKHWGVDYAGDVGDPVYAAASGTILRYQWYNGYGNTMILRHDDGASTLYAHLTGKSVDVNTTVKKGQKIATVGETGVSRGPHLHLEYVPSGEIVGSDKRIDPAPCVSGSTTTPPSTTPVTCTSSAGQSGTCKPVSECTAVGFTTDTNRCPSIADPNVKCCFTPQSCTVSSGKKGTCIQESDCTMRGGRTQSGLCPGPASTKCCYFA